LIFFLAQDIIVMVIIFSMETSLFELSNFLGNQSLVAITFYSTFMIVLLGCLSITADMFVALFYYFSVCVHWNYAFLQAIERSNISLIVPVLA